jgi:hypothetical protein
MRVLLCHEVLFNNTRVVLRCLELLLCFFVNCFGKIDGQLVNKLAHCSVEGGTPLEGPLALNSLLNNAERLYEGRLDAPEHIIERNGVLYVSLRTNEVVTIANNEIKVLVNFGKSCCKF